MNGRCPHCGSRRNTWGPVAILAAIRMWNDEHGKPPTANDWNAATPRFPAKTSVCRIFGTWNAAIEAAGFQPRVRHRPRTWDRTRMVHAYYRWMLDHGAQPTYRDWNTETEDRPSAEQAIREFGSWNAYVVSAGYEPLVSYRSEEGYKKQAAAVSRMRDELGRLVAA